MKPSLLALTLTATGLVAQDRPPITADDVAEAKLELYREGRTRIRRGATSEEYRRIWRPLARKIVRRFDKRRLETAEVGVGLATLFESAGDSGQAVALCLPFLATAGAGLEAPGATTRPGEPAGAERTRAFQHALNNAFGYAYNARDPQLVEHLMTEARRIFPKGDAIYSTHALTWYFAARALTRAPGELPASMQRWQEMVTTKKLETTKRDARRFGRPAPELGVDHLIGPSLAISLESMRGNVVLLSFFDSTAECRRTLKTLNQLVSEHAAAGLRVVGVTRLRGKFADRELRIAANPLLRTSRPLTPRRELGFLRRFHAQSGAAFPIVVEGKWYHFTRGNRSERGGRNFANYSVYASRIFAIDRTGILRYVSERGAPARDLRQAVEKLVSEIPAKTR